MKPGPEPGVPEDGTGVGVLPPEVGDGVGLLLGAVTLAVGLEVAVAVLAPDPDFVGEAAGVLRGEPPEVVVVAVGDDATPAEPGVTGDVGATGA